MLRFGEKEGLGGLKKKEQLKGEQEKKEGRKKEQRKKTTSKFPSQGIDLRDLRNCVFAFAIGPEGHPERETRPRKS